MILIINTCEQKLSELEFVKPIEKIVGKSVTKHYKTLTEKDINSADKIIICGTALADFEYLKHDFSWINTTEKPILGICAGMQIIAKEFGINIVENMIIGVKKIEVIAENKLCNRSFNAYFLHTKTAEHGFETIAIAKGKPCMIKHPKKEIYGCIFHPEVTNPEMIDKFVRTF